MGKRGPKKTDKKILQLRGSWRGDIPDNPSPLEPKRIRSPRWLSKAAQREWRKLSPTLYQYGLLNELTVVWWAAYVTALADLKVIESEISKLMTPGPKVGLFPEREMSHTKALNIRRLITIRKDLTTQLISILKEAGIAPEIIKPPARNDKARFFTQPQREPGPYAAAENENEVMPPGPDDAA